MIVLTQNWPEKLFGNTSSCFMIFCLRQCSTLVCEMITPSLSWIDSGEDPTYKSLLRIYSTAILVEIKEGIIYFLCINILTL